MSSDNSVFSTRPVRVLVCIRMCFVLISLMHITRQVACVACRGRKVKCEPTSHEDPPRSACKRCQKYRLNCEFKSVAEQQAPSAQYSPSTTHFQHGQVQAGSSTSAIRNWNTYPSSTQSVAQQPTSPAPYVTQHSSQVRPTVLGISTQGIKHRSYPAQPGTPDDDYPVRITNQRYPGPEQYNSRLAGTTSMPQTQYQSQGQGQPYHGTQSSTYPNKGWDQSQMLQASQQTPSNVGSTPNQAWYQQYSFAYG